MEAKWITSAVTVFRADGSADLDGCSRVYRSQVDNGLDGILVLGSLGEFFALPAEVKRAIVDNAVETIDGAVRLIVGTTSMVLAESIDFANYALDRGADAVMVVPPYYFKLPDDAIINYYDRIATGVDGPVYMYNFPAVTGYALKPEVIRTLALRHETIVGLKDTVTDMGHTRSVIGMMRDIRPDFEVYSGFDENFFHNLLSGGRGCVAGTSNFAPEISAACVRAARRDDLPNIAACQKKIDALMPVYTIGEQYATILKKAMLLRGIIDSDRCTAPLLSATDEETAEIRELLERSGLGTI